ncbi:MAG: oligosaccharide flippase family protein [Dehalococcoidia bacterium]|nr:oligosaccharide flippase family protein [Dehalococcoidia bacterium]
MTENSDIVDRSLKKVAKGTGIAAIGLAASLLFAFLGRLMVARYWTEGDYGIFSLAIAVLMICSAIGTLGLEGGLSRSIAYARSKNQNEKILGFIRASIQFAVISAVILSIVLFFIADILAESVFHEPALGTPLRIIALAIPFLVLARVIVSIFLGFERIKPRVFLQDVIRSGLFPLFLLVVILLNLSFTSVFYAYLTSFVVTCLLVIIYAARRLPLKVNLFRIPKFDHAARELFLFSIPLLGIAMLNMVIGWSDTIMLGFYRSAEEVGLYNAGLPLSHLILYPVSAVLLIYRPVMSRLYGQDLVPEVGRSFTIMSKWVFSASLPLFLVFFLFPETVLEALFGADYIAAADALRILSLGYILGSIMGPNGTTLVAMGKSTFIMWTVFAAVVLNVALNIALIPPYGIEGAAIASAAAITIGSLIRCWKLHSLTGAWPLSRNLLKPAVLSIGLILLIQLVLGSYTQANPWMLLPIIMLFYGIIAIAIFITRSFDPEDMAVRVALKRRVRLTASRVHRVLSRFK